MRNLWILLIFIFSSCNNTIKLSETIDIKTTKDSIDIDYQNINAIVLKINQEQIIEKIYAKYPDISMYYVDRIEIKAVKKTESLKKETNKIKTNYKTSGIYVEIAMNYEKSKPEQARQIIKYSKTLIIDELLKFDIKIGKE